MAELKRLDGVKVAEMGSKKSLYTLKVTEKKIVLPTAIKKALKKAGYEYKAVWMDAVGKVEKKESGYVFTARGSKTSFTVSFNKKLEEKLKKKLDELIEAGDPILLGGIVTEPPPPDGVDVTPPPEFNVGKAQAEKKD